MKKPTINTPPPNTCPVCGVQLAPHELEPHFHTELERLYKLSMGADRHRMRGNNGPNSNSFNINSLMHPHSGGHGAPGGNGTGGGGGILNSQPGPDSRWETFQRIRNNRQSRLRAKARKRKCDSESEFGEQHQQLRTAAQCQSCPVCHGRLQRTAEEIAQHVDECMRKQNSTVVRLQQQAQAQNVPADVGPSAAGPATGNGSGGSDSNGATVEEEEDETVDVESYGDETSVTSGVHAVAVNLAPGLHQQPPLPPPPPLPLPPLPSHIIPPHQQHLPQHHHHHHHNHHHHQHHPNIIQAPQSLPPQLPTMPNHNNNHIVKIDSDQTPPPPMPTVEQRSGSVQSAEEHVITSMTNPWDRKHRLTIASSGGGSITTTILPNTPGATIQSHHQTVVAATTPPATTSLPSALNITPPNQQPPNVSRATPTSSDQVSEYETEHRGQAARERSVSRHSSGCEPDEEHMNVDNHDHHHHHQHHSNHNHDEAAPSANKKARICDKAAGESNW